MFTLTWREGLVLIVVLTLLLGVSYLRGLIRGRNTRR